MAQVSLTKVQKVYPGDVTAVRDVDLLIEDQEFLVLVGPSGCGKSTTLRMIAGLEEISGGDIHIDGVRVNDVPPKDRDIAMVFQNYALYPHKNVYKNMSFGLEMRRYPKDEIDRRVREAAEILDITELLQRRPKALSGGQRQRVAVGRAIVRKPKVFLFDEPLSNLDAKLRVQMRAEISKLHQRLQSTMIYVTHDQVEAMTMGDRIVVMLDGVIQQVAAPLDIYQHPANTFVATFIGSPPMNLIEGTVMGEGDALYFINAGENGRLRLPPGQVGPLGAYVGRPVILGIRAEDVVVANGAATADASEAFAVDVDVVEPMGAETFVTTRWDGQALIARIGNDLLPRAGTTIRLQARPSRFHFFDPTSRQSILPGGEG